MGIVFESSVTVRDQYMTSNSVLVLTVLHGAILDIPALLDVLLRNRAGRW